MSASRADDVLALTELSYRYSRAVDARDATRLAEEVFTPDATLDYSAPGFAFPNLDAYLSVARDGVGFDASLHCFMSHLFDVDGDTAHGSWYAIVQHVKHGLEGGVTFMLGCTYEVDARRGADGWRFCSMVERPVWAKGNPAVLGGMYPADEA